MARGCAYPVVQAVSTYVTAATSSIAFPEVTTCFPRGVTVGLVGIDVKGEREASEDSASSCRDVCLVFKCPVAISLQ